MCTSRDGNRRWKTWIDMETRRRLLAACFLLDVHSACYHEQSLTAVLGLDYSHPGALPIPLTASTTQAWNAQNAKEWGTAIYTGIGPKALALNSTRLEALTPLDIASGPAFDAAILLAAYALRLPRRQNPSQFNLLENTTTVESASFQMANLFSTSGIANTYLALHYTPLHFLLSVSGDSWVFNEKVTQASSFTEHRKRLDEWRRSSCALAATIFAARALKAFFGLGKQSIETTPSNGVDMKAPEASWGDISDYWGVYVCALICWAFSHKERDGHAVKPSRRGAMQWILTVAEMESVELQAFPGCHQPCGVVALAREVLGKDCVGGRNILFEDAVGVLSRLEDSDGWKEF